VTENGFLNCKLCI